MKLAKFTSGVNTSFSDELNGNQEASLITAHQNRIDTLRSITERTPSDLQEYMQRDVFTVATGKNLLADTTNTTAEFDTDHYKPTTTDLTQNRTDSYGATTTSSSPNSITCTANKDDIYITSHTFYTAQTGNVPVYDVSIVQGGSTLATTRVTCGTGNFTATFTKGDYSSLIQTGTFTIQLTMYTGADDSIRPTNPFTATTGGLLFDITSQYGTGKSDGTYAINAVQDTQYDDAFVQTEELTSSGDNITDIFMTAQYTVDTTDLTYDASVDGGSTYTTGLSYNTINSITSTAGNQLILKHNIPGEAGAKLYGYSYVIGR
jgi:hypothetical protein